MGSEEGPDGFNDGNIDGMSDGTSVDAMLGNIDGFLVGELDGL